MSGASSTRALAMRQLTHTSAQSHERRLMSRVPSQRLLTALPSRVRRFSVANESVQPLIDMGSVDGDPSSAPDFPVHEKSDEDKAFILETLSLSFLFEGLELDDLTIIVDAMRRVALEPDTFVFHQGDPGDMFYIVATGSLQVIVDQVVVGRMESRNHFGELALMFNTPRNASIFAATFCELWALDRPTFRKIIVSAAARMVQGKVTFLQSVPVLSKLPARHLYRIAEVSSWASFPADEVIVNKDSLGAVFYLIKTGDVEVTCSQLSSSFVPSATGAPDTVSTLSTGMYFGEDEATGGLASYCARTLTPVECLCIHQEFFSLLIRPAMTPPSPPPEPATGTTSGENNVSVCSSGSAPAAPGPSYTPEEPEPIFRKLSKSLHPSTEPKPVEDSLAESLELRDLEPIAVLGEGAFGMVQLVTHKASGATYALKTMQKARIVEMSQQQNVLMEKNIMMRARHPYILRLYKTFQTRDCLFMVLEFCQGGDMFTLLGRQGGRLESHAACYYGSVVLSVLEYLHARLVAYRDLKPENLVFDRLGYLKVVDFGFAKIVKDRTYTLCGTPEYLAPELVQGTGHHHGVDYWALGILIYEMLSGYSPFADHVENSQVTIYKNIIAGKYSFPSFLTDNVAKDLVRKLLIAKDSKRLGCLKNGAQDVKDHPWFSTIDWVALLEKRVPPPIVPELRGATDTSQFDCIDSSGHARVVPYVSDGSNWDAGF